MGSGLSDLTARGARRGDMRSRSTGRRSRQRLAAAIAIVLGAVLLGGCADRPQARASDAPAGWTAYRDAERGFEVQFPSDWRRARRSLTPALVAPHEILSLGTGSLRAPGPDGCAQLPVGALDAMGPRDVLLSIQEQAAVRRGDPRAYGRAYRKAPASLRLARSTRTDELQCVDVERQDVWWLTFQTQGRSFYALAAMGREAPQARRSQAQRVLRSLRFARVSEPEAG